MFCNFLDVSISTKSGVVTLENYPCLSLSYLISTFSRGPYHGPYTIRKFLLTYLFLFFTLSLYSMSHYPLLKIIS